MKSRQKGSTPIFAVVALVFFLGLAVYLANQPTIKNLTKAFGLNPRPNCAWNSVDTHLSFIPDTRYIVSDIKAFSENDIWVVGSKEPSSGSQALLMYWDGSQWTYITSVPNQGYYNVYLNAIAGSPSDFWIVGTRKQAMGGTEEALIWHWNGRTWSDYPLPTNEHKSLADVSVISSTDIWAVGSKRPLGGINGPFTVHWNGSAWTEVQAPSIGGDANRLYATYALSANNVWAGGYYFGPDRKNLVIHWDGNIWTISSVPPNPGIRAQVNAMAGDRQSGQVWYAGTAELTDYTAKSQTRLWAGNGWKDIPTPVQDNYDSIAGMDVLSRDFAWAVGISAPGALQQRSPLILKWDGNSWSTNAVTIPSSDLTLRSVSTLNLERAWVAGEIKKEAQSRYTPLILDYKCSIQTGPSNK